MADDVLYMKQALAEAQKAYDRGEVPVGAVVVCKDRIIARSHNLTETLNDVTAHAEMQAITAAANYLGGKYLSDCTLYVTVEPCAPLADELVMEVRVSAGISPEAEAEILSEVGFTNSPFAFIKVAYGMRWAKAYSEPT